MVSKQGVVLGQKKKKKMVRERFHNISGQKKGFKRKKGGLRRILEKNGVKGFHKKGAREGFQTKRGQRRVSEKRE